jgi:DNA-binding CsgD family transcriptional regulator
MWPLGRPPQWVGREQELAVLRAGIEALGRGEGGVVWVEGEAGIGKSSLVAEALVAWGDPGWDVGWGVASRLTEQLPLRVMLDCLGVRPGSPDPRRARAGDLLSGRRLGMFGDGDASVAGVEVLAALADELAAAAPTVLVTDDLQWADEASLVVWHQLAASIGQLRLLLIGTCRPASRPEVQEVRAAVVRRGGAVITLGPLPETDVAALVTAMVGAPPGDSLCQLTAQAAGNPLYVRELVDALVREGALEVRPTAEVSVGREQLPASLMAVLNDRLSSVSAGTAQLLRTGALLGGRFAVTDLAVVARRPVSDLAAGLQEAVAAGILTGSGSDLAFRHLLIQQALYESMPAALSSALHAEAARELAAAGAGALSVAQQLSAAGQAGAGWARKWLIGSASALVTRAPKLAADLLQRELNAVPADEAAWEELIGSLVWALLDAGNHQEAARQATRALTVMTDPARRAETSWLLARAEASAGDNDGAMVTIEQALTSADLPGEWRARDLAWLAMLQRVGTGDLGTVEATARQALACAKQADDAFATAHALTDLWLTHGVRRDHAAALDYVDGALRVLGDDSPHPDLRSFALNARIFTLQNLDRWPDAELALRQARQFAQRSGSPDQAARVAAAVLRYWLGQWDDALAELGSEDTDAYGYLRERWPALLVHGLAALIAGRRDQRIIAGQALRRGLAKVLPDQTLPERENQDFLVAAHAVALEQAGETRAAMLRLAGILPRRDGEMTLTHQWLPDLVRLALAAGERPVAQAAAETCAAEAAAETWSARAGAASLRCQGLLNSDPDRLSEAVAHYRSAGPAVELPAALEDLAVVLAERGHEEAAGSALNEAVSRYEDLQARWDIRRAGSRLSRYGIKRGARSPRGPRAATGWEALTPTEVKVARLVAEGRSNPDVAAALFLSRNTVQTHVSHILTKLGAKGRLDIIREALRQGVSP